MEIENVNLKQDIENLKEETEQLKEKIKELRMNNNSYLNTAMCKAQSEFPIIPKDSNSFGNQTYASLSIIVKHTFPILNKYGLSVRFFSEQVGQDTIITAKLLHNSGQYESSSIKVLINEDGKNKNINQARGSGRSYAKRQLLEDLLGIATE